ncbi:hypothetical protein CLF_113157, partial [Clonorchis sinensis]
VEKQNWGEPCQFDYVYVFVGTGSHVKSHGPYCGNTSPPPVKYNETIQVTFTTDKNVTGKGFRLTFGPDWVQPQLDTVNIGDDDRKLLGFLNMSAPYHLMEDRTITVRKSGQK